MTAQGTLMPFPKHQFFDNNGLVAASYRVFFYASGTSTKQNAFSDAALSSALTNPTTLDASGRIAAGGCFWTPGLAYKVVLAPPGTDDPPNSPTWSLDGIQAIPPTSTATDTEITVTAGENIAANDAVFISAGDGGQTAGRLYRMDADATYSSSTALAVGFAPSAITSGATGNMRRLGRMTGLSGLVAGSTYYASATSGALTVTAPTNARAILQADSTTTGIILPGVPDATSTVGGQLAVGAQTLPTGVKTFPTAPAFTVGLTYASGQTKLNEIFARCTAALTKNNSTAVADVTGMAFAVGASETWEADFNCFGISPAAADWRFALTGPAAPTALWFGAMTANDPFSVAGAVSAFGAEPVASSTGGNELILLRMLLRNGANAGTVQLRMAQGTATVGDSIVNIDSYLVARRRV